MSQKVQVKGSRSLRKTSRKSSKKNSKSNKNDEFVAILNDMDNNITSNPMEMGMNMNMMNQNPMMNQMNPMMNQMNMNMDMDMDMGMGNQMNMMPQGNMMPQMNMMPQQMMMGNNNNATGDVDPLHLQHLVPQQSNFDMSKFGITNDSMMGGPQMNAFSQKFNRKYFH